MSITEPACVGGLCQACVGVPDLAAAIGLFECRSGRPFVDAARGPSTAPDLPVVQPLPVREFVVGFPSPFARAAIHAGC